MKTIAITADSPLRDIFAANVRRTRLSKGLSQTELADRVRYYNNTRICQIEANHSCPLLDTVELVAKGLGVTAIELLTPPAEAGAE